jgi:hypothetical protein
MKPKLRKLLDQGGFEEIAAMAIEKKRVLGSLVSLTFDPDPQIARRAVEAMGWAASAIARHDPEYVRNHLRRLNWLLSEESGAICPRAPEAMAEIVYHHPGLFAEFAPVIVSLLASMAEEDLEHFRPGILWAIGRLGPLAAVHVQDVLETIVAALDDSNPQARGMACWCLAQTGQAQFLAHRPALLTDEGPLDLYEDGRLHRTSVANLVRRLLSPAPG